MEEEFEEDEEVPGGVWGKNHWDHDDNQQHLNNVIVLYKLYSFILFCMWLYNNSFQSAEDAEMLENPEAVLKECLQKFETADYIMEPGIFNQLKRLVFSSAHKIKLLD